MTKVKNSAEQTRLAEVEEAIKLLQMENTIKEALGEDTKTLTELLTELVDKGIITEEEKEKAIEDGYIEIGDTKIEIDEESIDLSNFIFMKLISVLLKLILHIQLK